MIGDKVVVIQACGWWSPKYWGGWNQIWTEPDAELWFGRRLSEKAPTDSVMIAAAPFIFAAIFVGLVLDVIADSTPWNPVSRVACIFLAAASLLGFVLSIPYRENVWKHHRFLIRLDGQVIGVGDIYEDWKNGVCSLTAAVLPQYRGLKYGSIATRAMIRYSFERLNANRVESSALSTNPAALRMNDRMIAEGVFRERYFISDRGWIDEHCYRLLREEWLEQNAHKHRPDGRQPAADPSTEH